MDVTDFVTYREIASQPEALAAALRAVEEQAESLRTLWDEQPYERVIFTGCGSTHYLSLAAASAFQMLTGVAARGVPASELLLAPQVIYPANPTPTLLVAVSRSGATTETVRAVEDFQQAGLGKVVTIICQADSDLGKMGQVNIVIPAAQEESVAQTRAFTSMWVAACALAGSVARQGALLEQLRRLPDVSRRHIESVGERMLALGGNLSFDRIYFLGSGLRYGLACEGNLKMKEMSLTHTEPFHFLEFRHGPKSMVTESTLIVGLMSDDSQGYEATILCELRDLGAHLLVLSEAAVPSVEGNSVIFNSGLDEIGRGALYMPPLQFMALGRAVAKGLNPDRPRNLSTVVYLDEGSNGGTN
jgi:glucosamine--fructose-6-phosphate aminotransferase (isomerizing)